MKIKLSITVDEDYNTLLALQQCVEIKGVTKAGVVEALRDFSVDVKNLVESLKTLRKQEVAQLAEETSAEII